MNIQLQPPTFSFFRYPFLLLPLLLPYRSLPSSPSPPPLLLPLCLPLPSPTFLISQKWWALGEAMAIAVICSTTISSEYSPGFVNTTSFLFLQSSELPVVSNLCVTSSFLLLSHSWSTVETCTLSQSTSICNTQCGFSFSRWTLIASGSY